MEHLRGLVKSLKSQLRQERKKNKELSKRAHFYEDVVEEVVEEVEIKATCPKCQKGNLQQMDLKHLIITKCDNCDYNEKRKPNGEPNES